MLNSDQLKTFSNVTGAIISGAERIKFVIFQSKIVQLSILRSHLQLTPDRRKPESLYSFGSFMKESAMKK